MWQKINITTDEGIIKEAIAPIIISASRSTDIPAFYSQWFIQRWNKGHSTWINPFNQQKTYISFSKCRAIVFWTKNPKPLIPHLKNINTNFYFQFTLNDYPQLELNLPPLPTRIETFKNLSNTIGKNKVIWRYDPLIISKDISINNLIEKITTIGNQLHPYTEKLIISFADISNYKSVEQNLKPLNCRELSQKEIFTISKELQSLNKNWNIDICTCGEKIDLSQFNINHNKCIDDNLLIKLFPNDKELMEFLGCSIDLFGNVTKKNNLKDKGQRLECGCIISKDIGTYNTCKHNCLYCYANKSSNIVDYNFLHHNPKKDSII